MLPTSSERQISNVHSGVT